MGKVLADVKPMHRMDRKLAIEAGVSRGFAFRPGTFAKTLCKNQHFALLFMQAATKSWQSYYHAKSLANQSHAPQALQIFQVRVDRVDGLIEQKQPSHHPDKRSPTCLHRHQHKTGPSINV